MKPIAGLNRDASPFNQPENTSRYIANAVVSETLGDLENLPRDGFAGSFPDTFVWMGWSVVDESVLAVGWNTSPPQGEIYELTNPSYIPTLIIADPLDVWELSKDESLSSPGVAQVEFQFAWSKDAGGSRQLVWAPKSSQPKFVNIDALIADTINNTIGGAGETILGAAYSRKAFLLFPEGYLPAPTTFVIEDEGSVRSGAYFFTHRYQYEDGSSTDWSVASNPAYVVADTAREGFNGFNLHGDDGNKISPRAIRIIIDLDPEQPPDSFVQIAYISYREGILFAGILNRISLDSITANAGVFTYTGEQPVIDLGDDITELITPKAHYQRAGTLTSLTNRLYVGNLEESPNLLFQDVANAAVVQWCWDTPFDQSTQDFQNLDRVGNKTYQVKNPTFGPGEVYALYINFLKKNGTVSRAFHIPGRLYQIGTALTAATGSIQLAGNAAGDGFVGIEVSGPALFYTISPAAQIAATGSFTIGGVAAGDGVVGITYNGTPYNITPIAADTPTIMAAALAIVINGGGEITAVAAAGLITITQVVAGSFGNLPVTDNTTDTTVVGSPVGLSGGDEQTPAEMAAALVLVINAGGVITALDGGAGLITLTYILAGLAGNNPLLTATTDTNVTDTLVGMAGGLDFNADDIELVDIVTGGPDAGGEPRYKVFDTVKPTSGKCGTPGYWANPDENYPLSTDFDAARDPAAPAPYNNTVRHHRLPTLKYLYNTLATSYDPAGTFSKYDTNMKLILDVAVTIPAELASQIDGFYISYAKRPLGDTIVVDTEVPIPMGFWNNVYKPTCGPWNILGQGPAVGEDLVLGGTPLRWHGVNLVKDFVAVNPRYYDIIQWFSGYPLGGPIGDLTYFEGEGELYFVNSSDPNLASTRVAQIDAYKYGTAIMFGAGVAEIGPGGYAERVKTTEFSYVRNGTKLDIAGFDIDNMVGEDCLITIGNNPWVGPFPHLQVLDDPATVVYEWFMASLMTIPNNIAYPFTNQTLVYAMFERVTAEGAYNAIGGSDSADFFNAFVQYNCTGPVNALLNSTTDEAGQFRGEGTKIAWTSYGVFPQNLSAQHFNLGEFDSYVYPIQGSTGESLSAGGVPDTAVLTSIPKAQTWYFWDQNLYRVQGKFYNNDFNRLREFFVQDIYDGVPVVNNLFPVTIAFSLQQAADSPIANWRTWLVNNRYTQPIYAGDIINLQGAGNQRLYIHHRFSLFITKDRTTLKGTADVTIGSSDIFEVTPFEIITSDEGHTGVGRREWTNLSVMGYVWGNADHGKVFLHNGEKLQELSSTGMRIFFRDFMDENSAFGSSFNFVYDEDRKRLIMTAFGVDIEQRFTLSYSAMGGFWSSFHDEFYFNGLAVRDKNVLFRRYDPQVVVLDDIAPPGVNPVDVFLVAAGSYEFNDLYPFIVEVVGNMNSVDYLYLKGIKWSTNVIDEATMIEDYFDTFKEAFIYTTTKTSGSIDLVPYTTFPLEPPQNVRRLEKNWNFNEFRDIREATETIPIWINTIANRLGPNPLAADAATPWFDRGRMRDKMFLIRLTYDNPTGEKRFILSSIEFDFKESKR